MGDEVLAADEDTGEVTRGRAVTALIASEGGKTLVTITLADEEGIEQRIVATDGHPFWLPAKGVWAETIDLMTGDRLLTSSGARAEVTAIEAESRRAVVYNLTVATDHTYFVAGSGNMAVEAVLSHNARSNLCPNPDATGPHTSFRRDGTTGEIDHYETYDRPTDPRDPRPWLTVKRVDVKGKPHYDKKTGQTVPTPHVNLPGGSARAAEPWEIPRRR